MKYNKSSLLEILRRCYLQHDGDIKGKHAFQTIAIEFYKQPQETNRNYFSRLVISSIRVDVVAKTDDEVYVLSYIKMYSYFSFVFFTVPKKVQLLKISKVMELLWKSLPPWKNGREEHWFFSVRPYCTLLFSRKQNIKFSEVVSVAAHCSCLNSCLMIAWISALKYYSGYLLTCGKRQLKHWTSYQAY